MKLTSMRLGIGPSDTNTGAREGAAKFAHLHADLGMKRLVFNLTDDLVDPAGDALHLRLLHATGGDRWGADTHAAGVEGPAGIVWNGIGIRLDARSGQCP